MHQKGDMSFMGMLSYILCLSTKPLVTIVATAFGMIKTLFIYSFALKYMLRPLCGFVLTTPEFASLLECTVSATAIGGKKANLAIFSTLKCRPKTLC